MPDESPVPVLGLASTPLSELGEVSLADLDAWSTTVLVRAVRRRLAERDRPYRGVHYQRVMD